jgi:hypothetical protein
VTKAELIEAIQQAGLEDGQMIYLQRSGDDYKLEVGSAGGEAPAVSYGTSDTGPILPDAWTYQAARWAAGCGADLDPKRYPGLHETYDADCRGCRQNLSVLVDNVLEGMDYLASGHCRTSYAPKSLPREDMALMDLPDTIVNQAEAAPGIGVINEA